MVEIWKDIKGYEGLYQVSNLGRVKSLERIITKKNGVTLPIKEKILQYGIDRKGYYFVGLYKNSKGKNKSIARLVAEAFIPNPDNKPEINHINTIRTDNRVWVNEDGSTDPCLLPLEQLVAEIQQYDEQAVRIIHLPTGRTYVYLQQHRIFIDEDTGQKAEDMPAGGLYMDSPLRPEKFTSI